MANRWLVLNYWPIPDYRTWATFQSELWCTHSSLTLVRALSLTDTHALLLAANFKKWSRLNDARETRWDELNEGEERSFTLHQILFCCDCVHGQVRPWPDGSEHTNTHTCRQTHSHRATLTRITADQLNLFVHCNTPLRANQCKQKTNSSKH